MVNTAGLAELVEALCVKRDWSMHWSDRGVYLHLEASELIEAMRGKHGDPVEEAADVLMVLQSITQSLGIRWSTVVNTAHLKVLRLMDAPPYEHEHVRAR